MRKKQWFSNVFLTFMPAFASRDLLSMSEAQVEPDMLERKAGSETTQRLRHTQKFNQLKG